ncbi:protein FRG1 homolog [Scaptodrosophila lebanonensis]|uniref:Protein FRG1 homolog n=1 Tax=Drosophila lebanonensis TaxID=7225 RepID=A0A6J2TCS5_DROLE|nr:protein FRG1 homolog [Scaptodrosophila lebanonensis]
MSDYDNVRIKKLVLKGEKHKKSKKRKKEKERNEEGDGKKQKLQVDEDAVAHGGWWTVKLTSEITGTVAIEFGEHSYLKALDNGLFTVGAPHAAGESPDPEEIFTAFPINDRKVSFKSGYGKYLKIEKDGMVTGRSEAVGSMEQWEPVFENGQMALLSETGHFMSIDPEDDACVALRKKVGEHEICRVRSNAANDVVVDEEPKEEKGDLAEVEKNYVKKFQKFQDKKMRINQNDVKELEEAKEKGLLHETLLDRRSKMKADRYCK